MELTGDAEAQYNMLAMKIQRDINCLSDPDRNVRRRALDKLQRTLNDEAPQLSLDVLTTIFHANLQKPLMQCASTDAVEKCREKSLQLLLFFMEKRAMRPSDATLLKELVQMLNTRLGKLPYAEPTEEIRLLLLQLMCDYLKQQVGLVTSLLEVIPDLANVLGKTTLDPFPDVKKATSDCVIILASTWKSDIALQLGMIVKPMVSNLGHQHSRVRVCTLQALQALVPCGSESLSELMNDILLPAMTKVVFDRAALVRKQFILTIATWLAEIEHVAPHQAALLPLLLAGLVDESPEVQDVCRQKIAELSVVWDKQLATDDQPEPMQVDDVATTPPFAFASRPATGSRQLATRLQNEVLTSLLTSIGDWTVQVREKYTRILAVFLVMLEDHMNPFLDKIFAALSKICRDDEESIVQGVRICSRVIGFYADSQMILASLLPMVAGRLAGQDTAQHRTNGLILLGMSIEGMPLKTIEPHLDMITEAVCDAGVRESEVADLQERLAGVVMSLIETAGPVLRAREEISFRIFWVLSHLIAAVAPSEATHEQAMVALGSLATKRNETIQDLYKRFLRPVLERMSLPSDATSLWTKNHPSRVLFDSLCRVGGAACADCIAMLVPVFLLHLDASCEDDIRLAFLALLETMLGQEAVSNALQPYATPLLLKAIIPNAVWRGGRVAAVIRKVAIACTYTLLRRGLADQACLFEAAPQMLPVLKSSLDDSDAKTRQLVCLALQYLFVALPGCLGEDPVHHLYSEILKRLDDSNDSVRKAACETFMTFLKAAPKEHFKGTIIDYTLDCLFVHLDDADTEIQDAVMQVIKQTVEIDASLLIKKAQLNRSRHQNPQRCDQILEFAQRHAT